MLIPYLNILKKRNFFLLWSSQIISQFGDRLTQMALIGLVYRLKPGSSLGLAKILSLAIIPVFLISPIAGVYIDRWDKRKIMYLSDFLRGLCILSIPFISCGNNAVIFVYTAIFLSFCVGRFFIPAKMAIIPSLVSKNETFLGNSLVSITAMIAAMLGFGIGGIIVEKWGVEAAFLLNAITFFISALLIIFMKIHEETNFKPKDLIDLGREAIVKVKNSFLIDAKDGIKYIFQSGQTRYAVKVFFVLFAAIGSLYTVFIVFIQNTLSTITLDLGWLAVAAGAGLFLGSIIYGRIGNRFNVKKAINLSLSAAGVYLAAFCVFLKFHPDKTAAFFFCFFLGILVSPVVIAVNTLIHKESENTFWGRTFSSLEVIIHLAFVIFMFTSAYLAEIMTPFTIIVSVSIILSLFSLANLLTEK